VLRTASLTQGEYFSILISRLSNVLVKEVGVLHTFERFYFRIATRYLTPEQVTFGVKKYFHPALGWIYEIARTAKIQDPDALIEKLEGGRCWFDRSGIEAKPVFTTFIMLNLIREPMDAFILAPGIWFEEDHLYLVVPIPAAIVDDRYHWDKFAKNLREAISFH